MVGSGCRFCARAAAQMGFLVVMGASMLAGFRWTITQVLLQGDNKHGSAGGPIQVLFHLTPGAPPPPNCLLRHLSYDAGSVSLCSPDSLASQRTTHTHTRAEEWVSGAVSLSRQCIQLQDIA